MFIFPVEEHCSAWPPIPKHLTMVVHHGNSDTFIQLPGQGVTEGPHEQKAVVQTGILADDTMVELHGVVPHPTTPGFAATSSYRGTVVTSILVRSGEY